MCFSVLGAMDNLKQLIDNTRSATLIGRLAMNSGEPGQARKGAAIAVISCAGKG